MVSISAKDEVYFSKKFRSYPEWNWEANSTLIITYIYQLFSSHQMKLLHTWLVVKPLAQIYFQIQREITFYKIHKMIFFLITSKNHSSKKVSKPGLHDHAVFKVSWIKGSKEHKIYFQTGRLYIKRLSQANTVRV